MQPFTRTELEPPSDQKIAEIVEETLAKMPHYSREQIEARIRRNFEEDCKGEAFINDKYLVIKYRSKWQGGEDLWWLSIRRLDREAIHDWRELQQIKNEIVGPRNEGFEIYPSESRIVDTANQYHLWVFVNPEVRLPVGFFEGRQVDYSNGKHHKQRPMSCGTE
jgi:hypothetical protein